jgi:hypothetical protein
LKTGVSVGAELVVSVFAAVFAGAELLAVVFVFAAPPHPIAVMEKMISPKNAKYLVLIVPVALLTFRIQEYNKFAPMDKTAHTELHRLFLIRGLPEPLTPASSHLQIFDNYIENTRMRIREIRDPYTKVWTRILQQRFPINDEHPAVSKLAEMYLNDDEFTVFEHFKGREIRKNRYFHEIDGVSVTFDVCLGPLWGLNTARVDFETIESLERFEPPPIFEYEVSDNTFFSGDDLVDRTFSDVQVEVAKLFGPPTSRSAPE